MNAPADTQKIHDGRVRKARAELTQAVRVQEAADLVKAAADAQVQDARRTLWALGVEPDERSQP